MIHEQNLHDYWAFGKEMLVWLKKFSVGKMSYWKYFLEPIDWVSRWEKDWFANGTVFLRKSAVQNMWEIDELQTEREHFINI